MEATISDAAGTIVATARTRPFISPYGPGTEVLYRVLVAGRWTHAASRWPYAMTPAELADDLARHRRAAFEA